MGSSLGREASGYTIPKSRAGCSRYSGISADDAERRFGWFLRALRYGAPPHGGFAFGIDRLVAVLRDEPNIREVMPFPKTQTGSDPLTGAPTAVEEEQLTELGVRLAPVRPDA